MSFIPGVLVETLAFTLNLAKPGFAGHAGGQGPVPGHCATGDARDLADALHGYRYVLLSAPLFTR